MQVGKTVKRAGAFLNKHKVPIIGTTIGTLAILRFRKLSADKKAASAASEREAAARANVHISVPTPAAAPQAKPATPQAPQVRVDDSVAQAAAAARAAAEAQAANAAKAAHEAQLEAARRQAEIDAAALAARAQQVIAPQPQAQANPFQYAWVTTHDPPPAGDLIIRVAPNDGAAQIPGGGADKDGTVEIINWDASADGVWAQIVWDGGRRPAGEGYAKKAYLTRF